jgi:predicted MFS family arabinose efflux permease
VRARDFLGQRLGLSARGFTREVRAALAVDMSATALFAVFAGLTIPFNGVILRRELGASAAQLAVVASAGAAFNLLSLLWARALDGRAPLPYAVWPGFIARSLFLFVPFINSAWAFVGVLAAGSLLATIAEPANAAVLQRLYPRELRGRALGTVRMAGAAVVIALAAGAGKLLAIFDYRMIFPIAALFGMGASLRQRRIPVPDETAGGGERVGWRDAWIAVRHDPTLRGLLLAHFVFGSGIWLQMPATPLLLVDVLQAGTAHVGVLAAIGGAAGLIGNFWWGRLVDGRPGIRVLRIVYIIGAISPLIYYVAGSPWALVLTAVTDALMMSGLDMVWTMCLMDAAGPRRTAQYVAISATMAGVRGVACPLLSAVLINASGVRSVYLTAALAMIAGAFLLSTVIRSESRRTSLASSPSLAPALSA